MDRLTIASREAPCLVKGLEPLCWVYAQKLHPSGYAHIRVDRQRAMSVHKLAYLELVGPVPEGLELDHLCRNKACWNPWHLEPVPHWLNVKRGLAGAGVRKRAALVTACPRGHVYQEENDRRNKHGKRYCVVCRRERDRNRSRPTGAGHRNSQKTHCPQGHPYDYISPTGARMCKTCRREQGKAFRARQKAT
jgi:hypothetical protein